MKYVFNKLIFALIALIALSNQAAWAKEFNSATLTVVRKNSWLGGGTDAGVYFNGLKIGVVENGSQAKFKIPASGSYATIKITSENDIKISKFLPIDLSEVASDERSILISPGDNIFFEIDLGASWLKYIYQVKINP